MTNLFNEQTASNLEDIVSRHSSGDEILPAKTGNVGTRTRITSRRVTNSNRVLTASGSEVTLMHTLSVTTTRSWSGPRVESAAVNNDRHAVLGLDLIDAIPASSDLFGWVNDLDAFIKDHNVGLNETQVAPENAQTADCQCENRLSDSTVVNTLSDKTAEKSDQHPTHDQRTSGTELFGIVHAPSLSQLDLNLDMKLAEAHL